MPCARGPRNKSAYLEGLVILLQSPAGTLAGRETRHIKRDLEVALRLADILQVQTDCNFKKSYPIPFTQMSSSKSNSIHQALVLLGQIFEKSNVQED